MVCARAMISRMCGVGWSESVRPDGRRVDCFEALQLPSGCVAGRVLGGPKEGCIPVEARTPDFQHVRLAL